MANALMDQILGHIGPEALQQLANKTGVTPTQAKSAVDVGVPAILSGLVDNAKSPEGISSLLSALQEHAGKANLNDVASLLGSQDAKQDGLGILGHILGSQQGAVQQKVSEAAGILPDQAGNILGSVAPLIMSVLGNKTSAEGGFNPATLLQLLPTDAGGLMGMLGGLLNGGGNGAQQNDLASQGLKVLGGLFGKK